MPLSKRKLLEPLRAGLGLIEILIALVITLVVLVAMMGAFRFASVEMQKGRASLEMTNRLRNQESFLRRDLSRLTVEPKSYAFLKEQPKGYFQIVDGPATNANIVAEDAGTVISESTTNLAIGDYDDIIAGTIKSDAEPFRGRFAVPASAQSILEESHLAEVIWFTLPPDRALANPALGALLANEIDSTGTAVVGQLETDELCRLYRRELIIKPTLDISTLLTIDAEIATALGGGGPPVFAPYMTVEIANTALNLFYQKYDVSARVAPATATTFTVVPNTLTDLAIPANRFYPPEIFPAGGAANYRARLVNTRATNQQDVFLNGVAAFDVQVYDPSELVFIQFSRGSPSNIALPTDVGYRATGATDFYEEAGQFQALGAYVDLGKTPAIPGGATVVPAGSTAGLFGKAPLGVALSPFATAVDMHFDTLTSFFDMNNFDDDGDGVTDEGGDGIDNDADGLVDESAFTADDLNTNLSFDTAAETLLIEKEVRAPYETRISGLRIITRLIELNSGQVSQSTVNRSFEP